MKLTLNSRKFLVLLLLVIISKLLNAQTIPKRSFDNIHKSIASFAFGQKQYGDLHAHVDLKNTLEKISNYRAQNLIPPLRYFLDRTLVNNKDTNIIKYMLDSLQNTQSTATRQLFWQNQNQDILAATAGEQSSFGLYNQCDFQHIATQNFGSILVAFTVPEKYTVENSLKLKINKIATKIPENQLLQIQNEASDFELFLGMYNLLASQDTLNFLFPKRKIVMLRDADHYKEINNESKKSTFKTTGLIMTIEGANVLSNALNCTVYKPKKFYDHDNEKESWQTCDSACMQEILYSINTIKNLNHRLFFVGLGHFGWNNFSGTCKSMDKPGFIRTAVSVFAPNSLTKKFGQGLIDTVYGKWRNLVRRKNFSPILDPHSRAFPYLINRNIPSSQNSSLGEFVVKAFLDDNNKFKKPTYIDMKHMDVQARTEYIKLVKEHNIQVKLDSTNTLKPWPLIHSHNGCSGENIYWARLTSNFPNYDSYNELRNPARYYKRIGKRYQRQVRNKYSPLEYNTINSAYSKFSQIPEFAGYFYPWGLGLYDEEIQDIYESDGIIGIMADERTLGYWMKKQKKLYCNKDLKIKYYKYIKNGAIEVCKLLHPKTKHITTLTFDQYINMEPFLRTLVYILNKSGQVKQDNTGKLYLHEEAWNHVAIGSDFDGFINPINVFPTLAHIESFREYVTIFLPFFLETNPHRDIKNQIWDKRIYFNDIKNLDRLLDKLFYGNQNKFIEKYF